MNDGLPRATLHTTRISPKTCWTFVELRANDQRIGLGEATLNGGSAQLHEAMRTLAPPALEALGELDASGVPYSALGPGSPTSLLPDRFARGLHPGSLAQAAIASALDMALWDLHAGAQGRPLADCLGRSVRARVPIYANINRRTIDRTPQGFADSARDALGAGFGAFKIAPFDEVTPVRCAAGEGIAAMQPGLARIAAVREAIGADARLMVDCHWRFDVATARAFIEAAPPLSLHWIEGPIPETHVDDIPAIVRLRGIANALGIRLAGLEQGIHAAFFEAYCKAGAFDVMMPDVKYIGGLHEMLRCADLFARHRVEMSPHNPSGPIAHAFSLHLAAVMDSFDMLELQYDESPRFDDLVSGLPARESGHSTLPTGPGLGVRLIEERLAAYADREPDGGRLQLAGGQPA